MRLPGKLRSELADALLDAFDGASLRRFVHTSLEERLETIVGQGNLQDQVYELLAWAERQERVEELMTGAAEEVSGNTLVQAALVSLRSFLDERDREASATEQSRADAEALAPDVRRQGTGINPYVAASCQLFYSREAVMRELLADEQSGQSNLLLGGRRCGKTRLLEHLGFYLRGLALGTSPAELWQRTIPDHDPDQVPPELLRPHWPVLISLQGLSFGSVDGVLAHLGQCIVDSAPPVRTLESPPADGERTNASFAGWLRRVDGALAEARLGGLAFLVDEVEELLSPSPDGSETLGDQLLAFFRYLDDRALGTRVWFVLAGSERLERYRHPGDGSPPLNTTRRVRLSDLDYQGRRRMMIEPFVDAGRLPPPAPAQRVIDRLAAGSPWLLGRLLERLFLATDWRPEAIDAEAEEMLADQQQVFERWTSALDPEGSEAWKLYRRLASSGSIEESKIRGPRRIGARQLLEYHALVHRPGGGVLELGPELFRRWAAYEDRVAEPFGERSEPIDGPLPPGHFRYDVALSYATPQRELVLSLADQTADSNLRVLYDRDLGQGLWGVDPADFLPGAVDRQAEVCVLLVSAEYAEQIWPHVESRAALAEALGQGWDAVQVVALDGVRHDPAEIWKLEDGPRDSTVDVARAVILRLLERFL